MMYRYMILEISLLFSACVYSADMPVERALANATDATQITTTTENPDLLNQFEVSGFFERPYKKRLIERLEHDHSTHELVFFLAHDRLDPNLFGSPVSENTKTFVVGLQQKITEKLTGKVGDSNDIQKTLRRLSKHAIALCHICCDLELKARNGTSFGTVWAENPRCIWPFGWTRVDAEKFYKACARDTDFYRKKSVGELGLLFDATT